jgi:hypothetical protein
MTTDPFDTDAAEAAASPASAPAAAPADPFGGAADDPFGPDSVADDPFGALPAASPSAAAAAPVAAPAPSPSPSAANPLPIQSSFVTDSRHETRVRVSWPGRVQWPDGRVMDLRVRDVSETGVGLLASVPLKVQAVMPFAMGTPDLEDPKRMVPVSGTIRVVYVVLHRGDFQIGAVWEKLPDDQRELVGRWVRRLPRV